MERRQLVGCFLAVLLICSMLTALNAGLAHASSTPSIIDVGITAETKLPPETFLRARPGDRFVAWYDIAYSGPRITVKIRTTIIDPEGKEIRDPLGDPGLVLMEDMPGHTGWVGDDFEIPDTAALGTYNVKFSVWSEDDTQEYDSVIKSGWLELFSGDEPDIRTPIGSIDFGSVTVGEGRNGTKPVWNDGTAALIINSIARTSGSSDFAYSGPSTPFEIPAGNERTITVRFTPSSEGNKSAIFEINSNDPDEPKVSFNVSGEGVAQGGNIEVGSDPPGASFVLDGPTTYTGITPWSTGNAPVGTYTITWHPMDGYQTPPQETKNLAQGQSISFHGVYQQRQGSIEVTSDPLGASFTLSGPTNYSGVTPWSTSNALAGTYTITWHPMDRYTTPASESKTLTQGGSISFYANYQPSKGTIEVTSDPPGASFTLSGPENYRGVTPWRKADAPVGTYTVTWGFMTGYQTPTQEIKTLTQGGMLSFHGHYTATEAFLGANAATLWEYYSAWGKQLPPLNERAKMYEALGLSPAENYAGTAEQNTRLLNALKDRRICPSTADEISGVAPGTTIARLIEHETQERTPIIVDGEEYYMVTLKRYIEPETLQPFAEPSGWKVYVDTTGEPISDEDIVQQISLVKKANYIMSNIGSPVGISDTLQVIDEVLAAHEDLTDVEMVTFIAKELAFITVDVALLAGTGGTATPLISQRVSGIILDFGKRYTDPARLRADLGSGLLDAAKVHYKEADRISREQWAVTLRIDESGGLALEQKNFTRVTDALRAAEFLEHFYTAYLMEVYGTSLVLPIERINKNTLYEILGWVPEYIGDKISGNILSIFQLGKNLMEYPSSLEEYLQRINSMSSQVEELMVEPGRSARYTLALAHRDISFLKELPLEPYIYAHVASPVELRVHDSKGRTTGVIDGEIKIDIPRSYYSGGAVIIFSPSDLYEYEVIGTGEGSYDLSVTTVAEETNTFSLTNVPVSTRATHQYAIDWDALAKGGKGVTMKIDSDGDGTFEHIKKLGREGVGFPWVWIVVAGLSGLVGVLAGAFLVWRRIGKKQVAKR